jgi:hypothetical protein
MMHKCRVFLTVVEKNYESFKISLNINLVFSNKTCEKLEKVIKSKHHEQQQRTCINVAFF